MDLEPQQVPPSSYQQDESPFSRWRRLRNDPRFIRAVTEFCDWEQQERYNVAYDYATWWAPNVRNWKFEASVILERDIAVELLIERQARTDIEMDYEEAAHHIENYWMRKQLFAFWPRWVEHAHAVLGAKIWTRQRLERLEMFGRIAEIERDEIKEREVAYETIITKVYEVPLEWGEFVPQLIAEEREIERRRVEAVKARQEHDALQLQQLYEKQEQELEKQRMEELVLACDAERMRIEWQADQEWQSAFDRFFRSFG